MQKARRKQLHHSTSGKTQKYVHESRGTRNQERLCWPLQQKCTRTEPEGVTRYNNINMQAKIVIISKGKKRGGGLRNTSVSSFSDGVRSSGQIETEADADARLRGPGLTPVRGSDVREGRISG
jgi:hypothetical protein